MSFQFSELLLWFQNQQATRLEYSLSCSLLFITVFILLWLRRAWRGKSLNLPPSPPKLPIIGHIPYLGTLPHRSLQALSKKYGPLMLLHFGQTPTLIVSSAEMAKQIMKTHDLVFSNRPATTAAKTFLYGCKDLVFAPYGEYWRQLRKLCVIDLLSVKRVQSFRFVREEEIGNMVNKIKQACSQHLQVNLSELVMTVSNNVISRVAFSKNLGKSVYAELSKEAMDLFAVTSVEDMFPSLGWIDVVTGLDRRMKRTSKALLQFYDEVIEEHVMARKENGGQAESRDLVDILLDYEQDSTFAGVEFTRENIKGVIMNMFVAGTDTVYTTVEWTMAELVNHPTVMRKLQEEVRRVVGTKSVVDENEIKQMDYLNCVIKETMRLHPPLVLNLQRESTTSVTIEGYHIPAKTTVMVNTWAIARDPSVWERPEEFIPERFIDNPVDFRGQDFEFIPFGAGRRGCPGIAFGIVSVESVLVNLLYWFDWESPGGENKKGIDMTEHFGLSVNLNSPLCLVPKSYTI